MQSNTDYTSDRRINHCDRDRENEPLQRALADRERFLELHPWMRPYQAEIDRLLDKSGSQQGRLAVLAMLMQGKLLEMQEQLVTLKEALRSGVSPN
jgi:hypothetical protein